jgi:hypothetical protein
MKSPIRVTNDQNPGKFIKLGNNTYYYNYDIQEIENTELENNPKEYSYIQIHLHGNPNYKDCVKGIIRAYLSETEEFDLINSYNCKVLGLQSKETVEQDYKDYLTLVQDIKSKIKKDFAK